MSRVWSDLHLAAAARLRGRRARWPLLVLLLGAGAAGCQLREVTLAQPADVVVAEAVLEAGANVQFAWLHRTLGGDSLRVSGANVQVTSAYGSLIAFREVPAGECVDSSRTFAPGRAGSCYAAATRPEDVLPGARYTLTVVTADGRRLSGTTTVPGPFRLTRPASLSGPGEPGCVLAPHTLLPLVWTRSSGTWIYVSEARMTHVRRALDPNAPDDSPLDVQGFSVSAQDTTIVFPSEFGLFQRADSLDAPVLRALQTGLPAGVFATVMIAAADANYVNWVRRGSFNPSGAVQIPSVRGDGTGMFGSVAPVRFDLTSTPTPTLPACTS